MLLRLSEQQQLDRMRFDTTAWTQLDPVLLNWVSEHGGLPEKIKHLEKDLQKKGHDESSSVAIAVAAAKRFCAAGHADWCATVARWETMKGEAGAS